MRHLTSMVSLAAACGILATGSSAHACQATRSSSHDLLRKGDAPARKGSLDDRLVRPRARVDASAGTLG
jgi:hypothetical protein